MKRWFIHGLEFVVNDKNEVVSAPGEFWSNRHQWQHEGYVTLGSCPNNLWCAPSILVTDKFRSAAVPV